MTVMAVRLGETMTVIGPEALMVRPRFADSLWWDSGRWKSCCLRLIRAVLWKLV